MVITTSESRTASIVSSLGVSTRMSIPTSAMARTATGLTWCAGSDPAERTSIRPAASCVRKPAAIWERPALCTHTKSTDGLSGLASDGLMDRLREVERLRDGPRDEQLSEPGADGGSHQLRADEGGTLEGAMPENVLVRLRPIVTAGLANDVDEVKK